MTAASVHGRRAHRWRGRPELLHRRYESTTVDVTVVGARELHVRFPSNVTARRAVRRTTITQCDASATKAFSARRALPQLTSWRTQCARCGTAVRTRTAGTQEDRNSGTQEL